MGKKIRLITVIVAMLGFSQLAMAVNTSLYGGKTWWDDAGGIQAAAERVLPQVLVKLSGDPHAPEQWPVADMQDRLKGWVERYHNDEPPLARDHRKWVWVQLDAEAINTLLKRHGTVPWSTPRPKTLLWFVLDHDGKQAIFSDKGDSPFAGQLLALLNERGLAVTLPAMDKVDQAFQQTKQLWHLNAKAIRKASKRYHARQIVVVKAVYQLYDARWHAELFQLSDAGIKQASADSASLTQLLGQVADKTLETTYASVALIDSVQKESMAQVRIDGIASIEDYHNVLQFFAKHKKVKTVEPTVLEPGQVTFRLQLLGSASHFFRQLMAVKQVHYVRSHSDTEGDKVWQFVWSHLGHGGSRG